MDIGICVYIYIYIYILILIFNGSFKFRRSVVEYSECLSNVCCLFIDLCSRCLSNVWRMFVFVLFPGFCPNVRFQCLPALCVCVRAACGASATIFVDFRAPQTCASVFQLPAALRRPQRKQALDFWSMYPVDFVILLSISASPKPCASVSQLPAALRRPQKKDAPGFCWVCILCMLSFFVDFRVPPMDDISAISTNTTRKLNETI